MLCFSVGFRCTKWSGHWVWKRTLGHASHVPLYDVHSAAVPPFLSPSSRLSVSSSFILAPPLPYSASVARSSSSAPLGTPPPLWSRLPRSTFCSRWERDRNSRCTAECLCCCWSCVPVCACMCERRAHVWMHSCGAEERRVQVKLRCYRMSADCRLDADVSHQHGRGSCLDCWRGEEAAAAPDCDCLWTLLPPLHPCLPSFTGSDIWDIWLSSQHKGGALRDLPRTAEDAVGRRLEQTTCSESLCLNLSFSFWSSSPPPHPPIRLPAESRFHHVLGVLWERE